MRTNNKPTSASWHASWMCETCVASMKQRLEIQYGTSASRSAPPKPRVPVHATSGET
jgi:hypothetical protein